MHFRRSFFFTRNENPRQNLTPREDLFTSVVTRTTISFLSGPINRQIISSELNKSLTFFSSGRHVDHEQRQFPSSEFGFLPLLSFLSPLPVGVFYYPLSETRPRRRDVTPRDWPSWTRIRPKARKTKTKRLQWQDPRHPFICIMVCGVYIDWRDTAPKEGDQLRNGQYSSVVHLWPVRGPPHADPRPGLYWHHITCIGLMQPRHLSHYVSMSISPLLFFHPVFSPGS